MKGNLAEEAMKDLKTKKISLNLDVDTLEFIDELSKMTRVTKTTVIISLIGDGMKPLVNHLETSWKKVQRETKSEKVGKMLIQLNTFKKKWRL